MGSKKTHLSEDNNSKRHLKVPSSEQAVTDTSKCSQIGHLRRSKRIQEKASTPLQDSAEPGLNNIIVFLYIYINLF